MLNNLRNRLPDVETAGSAAVDSVMKAATTAAQSARDASGHVEEWAKDGLDSVRTRPLMWGAVSLGFGALMGGLYTLLRKAKPNGRAATRSVPARAHARKMLRASDEPVPAKKRAKKVRRAKPAGHA